jgi:hypothetical protein
MHMAIRLPISTEHITGRYTVYMERSRGEDTRRDIADTLTRRTSLLVRYLARGTDTTSRIALAALADARAALVHLTDAGRPLRADLLESIHESPAELLDTLPPATRPRWAWPSRSSWRSSSS